MEREKEQGTEGEEFSGSFWGVVDSFHRITAFKLGELSEALASFPWQEVTKVAHYWLAVNAMTRPMMVREGTPPYGGEK